ncbi:MULTISPECIES: YCF48-related protein [Pseudomonas]|uniref:YCF48-related protein n=1 Tax=Pseudomonas TaxID=286 RepID=UPI001472F4B5|nr:YCF48-related protein [Pseudomonas proteolytica]NMZ42684.1 glycosyl hydrolase [Pseudomonas proteolytica]
MRAIRFPGLAVIALFILNLSASAIASPRPTVLDEPAQRVENPEKAYLLGIAKAGKRLVAVGEAGRIILSDDNAKSWHQAQSVPVSVLLTDVAFADDRIGWAVGHLGVVLRTEDGGRTWHKQLDGIKVAELMLAQATSMVSGSSEAQALAVDQAKRLVEDGPDKPFLALHVSTPEQALVIGAYGLALRTSDGGQHWSAATQIADNPGGLHYYSAAQVGNAQLLVGEQGMLLRSVAGEAYERIAQPYSGTLFGCIGEAGGPMLAFGLRGNVVKSVDGGTTWKQLDSPLHASVQAATLLSDGTIVLAAENGQVVAWRAEGGFSALGQAGQPIAALVQTQPHTLILVGPHGVESVRFGA